MAKNLYGKPQIVPPRPRIPVSEEDRREAFAGMGGELTKIASETAAAATSEPLPAPAKAPATADPAPERTPAPAPIEEPATVLVEASPVLPVAAASPQPVADLVAAAPVAMASAAASRPRGRKPAPADAPASPAVKSMKMLQSDWQEIRRLLPDISPGTDMPTNILTYLHAAHRHYETHLRKTGKLVPGN